MFVRTLRELCGVYHPEEVEENKRFTLLVDGQEVPVFVGSQTKAEYPEIRIHPFFYEEIEYKGAGYGYSPGVGPTQDPNIMYKTRGEDLFYKTIISQIEIYSKSLETTLLIRDAVFQRIMKFGLLEHANVKILYPWEKDGNVYINRNYDTGSSILRVSNDNETLSKTSEFETTPDSWYWDGENLYVNTDSDIGELDFMKNTNNGLVFHDGTDLIGRGFYNLSFVKNKQESDRDPHVSKWEFRIKSKYQEIINLDMGESFAQVNVNDQED
jgi:hypothetical protein